MFSILRPVFSIEYGKPVLVYDNVLGHLMKIYTSIFEKNYRCDETILIPPDPGSTRFWFQPILISPDSDSAIFSTLIQPNPDSTWFWFQIFCPEVSNFLSWSVKLNPAPQFFSQNSPKYHLDLSSQHEAHTQGEQDLEGRRREMGVGGRGNLI